ncbi:NAD-P-binding protein [Gautieria morchelliformis]|nr:NAD-P-binding protein [Gautieria morchelliformis]
MAFRLEALFNVKDKVVLVTGGSRGIGKMIATGFVQNGCKVYISSRTAKECDATANELSALGPGKCISVPADLQQFEQVRRLVDQLQSQEKGICLIPPGFNTLTSQMDAAFAKILTLNVQRVFTLTQLCLPLLREAALQGGQDGPSFKDPARIINIGSVEGERVPRGHTYSYAASKAAVHQLSRHLAGRLGHEGITSNTIACGPFESKMMAHTLRIAGNLIKANVPLQRIGTPEDVAGTTLFLASRAGAYVNGATIALDGGSLVSMRPRGEGKL